MGRSIHSRLQLRVLGLRRSGNHAIINWILKQSDGPVIFLNNVRPGTDPWVTRDNPNAGPVAHSADVLVYSYEDSRPKLLADRAFERRCSKYLGTRDRHRTLLILRDPYNLFASRIRKACKESNPVLKAPPLHFFTMADLWLLHAREYLGITRYLADDTLRVSYNRWCVDREYRRELAQTLGLPFTDAGFEEVSNFGGGSSFDGTCFNNLASGMKVLNRYEMQLDNLVYRNLFRDPRISAYSARIFSEFPELNSFYENSILPRIRGQRRLRSPIWDRTPIPLESVQHSIWKLCDHLVHIAQIVVPKSIYRRMRDRFRHLLY